MAEHESSEEQISQEEFALRWYLYQMKIRKWFEAYMERKTRAIVEKLSEKS